jgi:flagellar hook-associated protein 3 FlgL
MSDVANVQQKLAKLQQQISSGLKADNYAELNGYVEQYTLLQQKIRSSQQYFDTNTVTLARLKTADQAVGNIVDIADSMENLIVQGRNSAAGDSIQFQQVMLGYLQQMSNELNMNFEGRYLFGGTNTNSAPVTNLQSMTGDIGIANSGYYQGSTTNIVVTQDERSSFEWPVRADNPAFQKIIAAAHQAIQAFESKDDAGMASALDLMQEGQKELNATRSQLNNVVLNVEATNERLDSLKLYWKGVSESVANTDLVSATTEVSNHEALLQAAFAVFARISQLRLTDYLR